MSETFRTSKGWLGTKGNPHFTWDPNNPDRSLHATLQLPSPSPDCGSLSIHTNLSSEGPRDWWTGKPKKPGF